MLPEDYTEPSPSKKASLANLKEPWPAGYCPNPNGRPKGSRNRQTIVREALEAHCRTGGKPVVDILVDAQVAKAATGDTPAFRELMDSGYGKIADTQNLQHLDADGKPTAPPSALPSVVIEKLDAIADAQF